MVQAIVFTAHTLLDALFSEYTLVLIVLILPALIRMEDQSCSIWDSLKCFLQHGSYHAQYWPVRDGIADQISLLGKSTMYTTRQVHMVPFRDNTISSQPPGKVTKSAANIERARRTAEFVWLFFQMV